MTNPGTQTRSEQQTKRPWLWNVVLLNDEHHTYEYVIDMCQKVFAHTVERGHAIACRVDKQGRAVLLTTHKELAELKCEQVITFGKDHLIAQSKGAMGVIIEPAEFGDGDEPVEAATWYRAWISSSINRPWVVGRSAASLPYRPFYFRAD